MPVEDNLDVQPEGQGPARSFTKSQLGSILPAIFVVVVLIGSLAVAFVTLNDDDGTPTSSVISYTPDGSFIGLFDAYNAGDARTMTDFTIYYFSDQYEQIVTEFEGEIEDNVITVLETEVFYREDMATGDQDNIQQRADFIADQFGITIDDFCVVVYECDFGGEVDQGSMICYNVGGQWYVTLEDYFLSSSPTLTPVSTPAGSWNVVEATSQTSGRAIFASFTSDIAPRDVRIYVYANGTYLGYMSIPSNTAPTPQSVMFFGNSNGIQATYFDYNAAGGLINPGDYISLTGLRSNTLYSLKAFYVPTGEFISMTGDVGQFMTP